MDKIKKQLILFSLIFIVGFIFCGAVSAAQYADLQVSGSNCQVSSDGETADFSLTIANKGPYAAVNVVLQDKMAGVDVSTSQYSINNGAWQDWNKNYINLGTLQAGSSVLIEFRAEVIGTTLSNKADVTSSTRDLIRNNNYQSITTKAQYTILSTAGTGGSINPIGDVHVYTGNSQSYTINPDAGMKVEDVQVDGNSVGVVTSYTFHDVRANHTINAVFSHITHTITATAGPNGNISPNGSIIVNELDDQTFNITPDEDYAIEDVLVDGVSVGTVNSYTFHDVTLDHTITANFIKTYDLIITVFNPAGGNVDPNGTIIVNQYSNYFFNYTVNPGYTITVEDNGSYWFKNDEDGFFGFFGINADHIINVRYSPFIIITTAGAGGSISPSGNVNVNIGNSQVFTITPDAGYRIGDVFVDGVSQGAITTYTFGNVQENHQINAEFIKTYNVTGNVNIPSLGSITPNGTFTVDAGSTVRFDVNPNPNVGGSIYQNGKGWISITPGMPMIFYLSNIYEDKVIDVAFIQY